MEFITCLQMNFGLKGILGRYPHTYSDWANLLFQIGVQDYVTGFESEL